MEEKLSRKYHTQKTSELELLSILYLISIYVSCFFNFSLRRPFLKKAIVISIYVSCFFTLAREVKNE